MRIKVKANEALILKQYILILNLWLKNRTGSTKICFSTILHVEENVTSKAYAIEKRYAIQTKMIRRFKIYFFDFVSKIF